MKITILLFLLLGCSAAIGNVTYTTHDLRGNPIAVFTQVQGPGKFGLSWRDPSGTIWSSYQGEYANNQIEPDQMLQNYYIIIVDSPATEACAKIGGILPTTQDYESLVSYFDVLYVNVKNLDGKPSLTDQGRKDLYAIFPDMISVGGATRWFWSASSAGNIYAQDFVGYGGDIYIDYRYRHDSVRCVAK